MNKYFNLSPSSDLNNSIYFEALDEKFADETVKNIAITGSYGSGKSSIIESYFANKNKHNKHIKLNKLNISLANFCELNNETNGNNEKIIEEQILQQVFYQLSYNCIPFSGFKKIIHLNKRSQKKLIFFIIIWLFSAVLMPSVIKILNKNILSISSIGIKEFFYKISWLDSSINILTFCVFSIGLFYILKELIKIIQKGQLKKVAMKSTQVELSENSALNKHIDELIYFFEATDKNIVIIEDLDRFNSITLFTKLREVNFLINNSPKVKQIVKFVYAIRDEVFTNNLNRTKFFDFILPIVPVINTTNSGDILRNYLKNDNKIPHAYINDISLYIHDLRLLKNIVNEYRIYNGVINENNKKRNTFLFSIILYKNLFPLQFGLEHSEKGFLHIIFTKRKYEIIDSLTKGNRVKIDELTEEKNRIIYASVTSKEKLRHEYIIEILKSYPNVICNNTISSILLNHDDFINILKNPEIQVYENYGVRYYNFDFSDIQKKVNSNFTYEERLKLLEQIENADFKKIDEQISKIKSEVAIFQRKKLSGLIKQYQDNTWKNILFDNKDNGLSSEDELLALLIRKGYIDEDYQLYMSYFYEGNLSLSDFEFLLNVKNNDGDNFNTDITNINELISKISEDEYEYEATINKKLICNLLKKLNYKEDRRLELILLQFSHIENALNKYIIPLIEALKNNKIELQRFIELIIVKYYPTIWQSIENQNYEDNFKDSFIKLFLFLPESNILALNDSSGNKSLKNYLSIKEDFIDVFNYPEEVSDTCKLIKVLNIKFQKLTFKRYDNNQLFNYIYQNNNYELNIRMLYLMLFHNYNLTELEFNKTFNKNNYTSIIESSDILKNYITSNFTTYLENIYVNLESQQAESENAISSIIELLEDENNADLLFAVLSKISTKITDIKKFSQKKIWNLFFTTDCVDPNWENLIEYFKFKESIVDYTCIRWLNNPNVYHRLTKNSFSIKHFAKVDSNLIYLFTKQIVENNKIMIPSYERLLNSFPYIFNKIALDKLTPNKINHLIKIKKIKYNTHHYNILRDRNLSFELFIFTSQNISQFVGDYNNYEFNLNLHKRLLESSELKISYKKKIIELLSIENIKDSRLSSLIGYILLNTEENIIGIDKIISVIFSCDNFNLKLQLFNKLFNYFNFEEIEKTLGDLGDLGDLESVYKQAQKTYWENNVL